MADRYPLSVDDQRRLPADYDGPERRSMDRPWTGRGRGNGTQAEAKHT